MRGARIAAALAALAALAHCRTPPPDFDGQQEGALPLALAEPREDSLECRLGDCADWYRIEVAGAGDLEIDIETTSPPSGSVRPVRAELVDERGEAVGEWSVRPAASGAPALQLQLRRAAQRGAYWVALAPEDPRSRVNYRLLARFRPAQVRREPAKSRFETRRSAVLEVEGSGTRVRAVLLEAGAAERLRPGLRGRLVERGQTIAEIEIVEVFAEGSRARIAGELRDPIGPGTTAEIRVPLPAPAAPDPRERD